MQIRTAKVRLLILAGIDLFLSGCSISDWYNGYYVDRSVIRKIQKEREEIYNKYYKSESPEIKELREQNFKYCIDLANKPENRVARAGYPNGVWNRPIYIKCMRDRGTPVYGFESEN